jgi:hypothetical protein
VHFCNRTNDCSLVCETYVEDGVTVVDVPNILLQTNWRIHAYAYDGSHTKHEDVFDVVKRTKPADYVYTETDIFTVEEVVDKAVKDIAPQKGIDYWTEEDKAEIVAELAEDIPVEVDKALAEMPFVLGENADISPYEENLFVIGNGTDNKYRRSNALRVDKQGNMFVGKVAVVEGLNVNTYGLNVNGESRICNCIFGSEQGDISTRSTVTGKGSVAINRNNTVNGIHSFAALSSNTIPATYKDNNGVEQPVESVFIAGHGNTATAAHQVIFGTYAKPETSDCFAIGCGVGGKPKNALAADRLGNIRVGGTFTIGNTTITEEQLQKLLQLI